MPGDLDTSTSTSTSAGSTGDSSSSFDMSSALSQISEGLGFGSDDHDGTSGDSGDRTDPDNSGDGGGADDNSDASGTGGQPPAPAPGEADDANKAPLTPPPGPEAIDTKVAPKTWTKEGAAGFETLPEHVRAEIHKREQDMWNGLDQYKTGAQFGWAIADICKPYDHLFQQFGVVPQQILPGLLSSHATLTVGNEQAKLDLFDRLVKEYHIPLPKLLAKLTGGALENTEPFIDPTVKNLQESVQTLQSKITERERAELTERQAAINQQVSAFFADPANIYAAELADDISTLIRSGVTKDLKVAYEKAMWANPVTRAKEQARIAAEAEATRRKAADEAAKKARQTTAANVKTTRQGPGPTARPDQSLDETLRATYAKIQARG